MEGMEMSLAEAKSLIRKVILEEEVAIEEHCETLDGDQLSKANVYAVTIVVTKLGMDQTQQVNIYNGN